MGVEELTLDLQAPAWCKGPYGPAPAGWERSSAPFRAKDEIEFLCNRLLIVEKQRDGLLTTMEHIRECWDGETNMAAMVDALNHIEDVATEAIAAAESRPC